ncbi:hypothetical protein D6C93_01334 [Aureobasidium pullulans]|nr:hypothetical protein D6C93_01334 [Aureobasidium pullulans]
MHLIRRAERSTSTSSSASSISTATSGSSDALPRPFDTGLGNNFTTSTCPIFFKTFLSDETFNECVPLSLLLQTSTSFFTVQRSPVRLAQTLSASCSVNFDTCSTLMASLARQIQDTMSAFGSAATNRSQPVSNVFASAAAMIDLTCGADFVNASIPHQPISAAASFASTGLGGLGGIALLVSLLTALM